MTFARTLFFAWAAALACLGGSTALAAAASSAPAGASAPAATAPAATAASTPAPAAPASSEIALSASQFASLGVRTAAPVPAGASELVGLSAQVLVPNEQLRVVSAPLAGLVEQILVATQQSVRRGQLLARLQSPGLADLQHTFLQAATQLELARTQLERDEELFGQGIVPLSRVQSTRARWVEVSADHSERIQALRLAGMSDASIESLRQGRRVGTAIDLVAPIDGVVLELPAVVGQRIEAATAMVRVARLDPLWLEAQVPVSRMTDVRVGAVVRVPSADAEARVIAVGRNVNTVNQTVTVRAVSTRGAQRLLPGQALEVVLASPSAQGRWSVPPGALVRTGEAAGVLVRTPRGFRRVPVAVVSEGLGRIVVSGALQASDQLAVEGVSALKAMLSGTGAP